MRRVKRRTFSGAVCEQEVFIVSDRAKNIRNAEPRIRFKTEEEREKHRLGIARRRHARLVNENFSPRSLYSTLTFDNDNEVHTFQEAKHIRDLFVRRLKYAFPDSVIFTYLGRGKHTKRIHLHMISDDVPKNVIQKQWLYGTVIDIEHLREHNYYNGVDYGQDYTGLANYLFDHWTTEQGGQHYSKTRNARQPDREPATEIKRNYTEEKPPRPPKGYILVETKSTQYGYLHFKYVKKPPKRHRNKKTSNSS